MWSQAIEAARIEGASKIIGVDKNGRKKEKGEAFGMTDFINPEESGKSVSELIKEKTGGIGVDNCIECSGVPSLINEALMSATPVCALQSTYLFQLIIPNILPYIKVSVLKSASR